MAYIRHTIIGEVCARAISRPSPPGVLAGWRDLVPFLPAQGLSDSLLHFKRDHIMHNQADPDLQAARQPRTQVCARLQHSPVRPPVPVTNTLIVIF